jgi:hypothetical protein
MGEPQQAIGANVRRRLVARDSLWKALLSSDLSSPAGLFRIQARVDPGPAKRPKDILKLIRPDLDEAFWRLQNPWLFEDIPNGEGAGYLCLSTAPMTERKVFDLKWRILCNAAVSIIEYLGKWNNVFQFLQKQPKNEI